MPFWTALAKKDLQIHLSSLVQEDPGAARRTALTIKVSCAGLDHFPKIGPDGPLVGIRELAIPGTAYVCVYRVAQRRVEILRLLHTCMQWPR